MSAAAGAAPFTVLTDGAAITSGSEERMAVAELSYGEETHEKRVSKENEKL